LTWCKWLHTCDKLSSQIGLSFHRRSVTFFTHVPPIYIKSNGKLICHVQHANIPFDEIEQIRHIVLKVASQYIPNLISIIDIFLKDFCDLFWIYAKIGLVVNVYRLSNNLSSVRSIKIRDPRLYSSDPPKAVTSSLGVRTDKKGISLVAFFVSVRWSLVSKLYTIH
jgi:hypothetical protein